MLEALSLPFFQRVLAAALLASIASGVIGTYVVAKRITGITGGLAHASFGGVGLGYLLGFSPMLVAAGFGFGFVDQTFFPDSARLQLMIDYWAPEGTRIQTVSGDVRQIEARLIDDPKVESVSTFVGQGPPRFYLPVEPEKPYPSYGQLIVNVNSLDGLNALIPEIDAWLQENVPQAVCIVRRYGLGPSETWKVEARISGPAIADAGQIRALGEESVKILEASPHCKVAATNWRQRVKKMVADYDAERARWARISRANIGRATRRGYDGYPVGQFRERDKVLPILLRHVQEERDEFVASVDILQVHPTLSSNTVPLRQSLQKRQRCVLFVALGKLRTL